MLKFFLNIWLFHMLISQPTAWDTAWYWLHRINLQSTTAEILIWLYGTQTSFLKNWLCSLSTSWQMIKMNQLLVSDTSFHSSINCTVAVQNLFATKCIFQSVDRRLVLMCRMGLTFVIMKGSRAAVPVAAEPRGSSAEPKGTQESGRKMATPQCFCSQW